MANSLELRNSHRAKTLVLQSLALARLAPRGSPAWLQGVRVAVELASSGAPLLAPGFLADVCHLLTAPAEAATLSRAGLPEAFAEQVQPYEDYVLGKLYADSTFERGAAAVARYKQREQDQAIAFVVDQFRQRADLGGISLSPGVLRGLQALPTEQLIAQTAAAYVEEEALPELFEHYAALIARFREVGDLLGGEDLFELEHRTAIAPAGERLALRQILATREKLLAVVPSQPPRRAARLREVPTRLLDENAYPVGGFSSISTRGTIESLLHSQLAFMEPAGAERPDMFDIKFLRDELLYYSRDENQFFRRRRTFVIALYPDLRGARVKDAGMPYQRIVLALGTLLALIERLIAWLGDESLRFEILLIDDAKHALSAEAELLRLMLREQVANGTAAIELAPFAALTTVCAAAARHSLCQVLTVSAHVREIEIADVQRMQCVLDAPEPALVEEAIVWHSEAPGINAWSETLARLLDILR
jgi:hypothetical protein